MKKLTYTFLFIAISYSVFSQVWIEGFTLYSFPTTDWAAKGISTLERPEQEPLIIDRRDLFTFYADPQFGGGVNLRYAISRLVVGMQVSYVGYKAATIYLRGHMFRLGPSIEYHFNYGGIIQPYVGGEWGLQSSKVYYNKEIIGDPKLAETHLGIGPRAGLVFKLDPKIVFRLGASYVYLKKLPYLDITAGLAFNVGDF